MIFDLCINSKRNMRHGDIPGSLTVSKGDLPNLLKWLPPRSTVAFSCGDGIKRLDPQIEGTLLQLGIEAVYLLNDGADVPLTVKWEGPPKRGVGDK